MKITKFEAIKIEMMRRSNCNRLIKRQAHAGRPVGQATGVGSELVFRRIASVNCFGESPQAARPDGFWRPRKICQYRPSTLCDLEKARTAFGRAIKIKIIINKKMIIYRH